MKLTAAWSLVYCIKTMGDLASDVRNDSDSSKGQTQIPETYIWFIQLYLGNWMPALRTWMAYLGR